MARSKIRYTYAIGDIQGCYQELLQLLELIEFDATQDRLWLTGDLVSRGPQSLEVLRYVKALGESALCTLGNHDLHLLAAATGVKQQRLDSSLIPVMEAEDRDELLDWLRHRPLLHRETRPAWPHEWVMVHAGLPPQWTVDQAESLAREVEDCLRGVDQHDFYRNMYGDQPDQWSESLKGWDRLRFITNCLTRLRYCTEEGRLMLEQKGKPAERPDVALPWFMVPARQNRNVGLIFGHWSTLGQVVWSTDRVYGLDGGCLWGGNLIALRLEDMTLSYLPCDGYRKPG